MWRSSRMGSNFTMSCWRELALPKLVVRKILEGRSILWLQILKIVLSADSKYISVRRYENWNFHIISKKNTCMMLVSSLFGRSRFWFIRQRGKQIALETQQGQLQPHLGSPFGTRNKNLINLSTVSPESSLSVIPPNREETKPYKLHEVCHQQTQSTRPKWIF